MKQDRHQFHDRSAEKLQKSVPYPSLLPSRGQYEEEGQQTPDWGSKDKRKKVRIRKNLMKMKILGQMIKWTDIDVFYLFLSTVQGLKMSPPNWSKPSFPPLGPGMQTKERKRKHPFSPLGTGQVSGLLVTFFFFF